MNATTRVRDFFSRIRSGCAAFRVSRRLRCAVPSPDDRVGLVVRSGSRSAVLFCAVPRPRRLLVPSLDRVWWSALDQGRPEVYFWGEARFRFFVLHCTISRFFGPLAIAEPPPMVWWWGFLSGPPRPCLWARTLFLGSYPLRIGSMHWLFTHRHERGRGDRIPGLNLALRQDRLASTARVPSLLRPRLPRCRASLHAACGGCDCARPHR